MSIKDELIAAINANPSENRFEHNGAGVRVGVSVPSSRAEAFEILYSRMVSAQEVKRVTGIEVRYTNTTLRMTVYFKGTPKTQTIEFSE